MTHQEFVEKMKSEFIQESDMLFLPDWQHIETPRYDFQPDNFVFCEIITAFENKRNIIRISSSKIKKEKIPASLKIDVINIKFKSPSHPNIGKHEIMSETIFDGTLSEKDNPDEFSFPLLVALLKNIEGFFYVRHN
jgi:hypothetical protein